MSASTYKGASAEAIRAHYDLGNEFYALWLDPSMTYSCALWDLDDPEDTLEHAQQRKLDLLIGKARAVDAGRVLDVGCGWGSLLRRLTEHHGVAHATGLTLSPAQAEYARERSGPGVEVRVENWTDHEPTQPYEAIISIGAFEHFASFAMGREERLAAYRRFFERCAQWLEPGGRLVVQTISKGNNTRLDRQSTRDLLFIIDRIFRESELPWPSEALEASERLFETVSLHNDTPHYAKTCTAWLQNLRAAAQAARELVGEEQYADYERYLAGGARALTRRHIALQRLTFERV
jgi:cyclopropane-fatty-acyl-phospholipid synthase